MDSHPQQFGNPWSQGQGRLVLDVSPHLTAIIGSREIRGPGLVVSPFHIIVIQPPLCGAGWAAFNNCCTLNAHYNVRVAAGTRNGAAETFAIDFLHVDGNRCFEVPARRASVMDSVPKVAAVKVVLDEAQAVGIVGQREATEMPQLVRSNAMQARLAGRDVNEVVDRLSGEWLAALGHALQRRSVVYGLDRVQNTAKPGRYLGR